MVKAVETLVPGETVSFAGSGKSRYRIVNVARLGGAVHLDVASNGGHRLTACYYVGELAEVHS